MGAAGKPSGDGGKPEGTCSVSEIEELLPIIVVPKIISLATPLIQLGLLKSPPCDHSEPIFVVTLALPLILI